MAHHVVSMSSANASEIAYSSAVYTREFLFHRTHYAAINAKNSVTAKMPAEKGRPVQCVVRLATAITIAQLRPLVQTALAITLPSARATLNGCFKKVQQLELQ